MGKRTKRSRVILAACAALAIGCSSSLSGSTSSRVNSQAERGEAKQAHVKVFAETQAYLENPSTLHEFDERIEAYQRIVALVKAGYAPAQYWLGANKVRMQKLGMPDPHPDTGSAADLFQKAAAQNHPAACYQVARLHMRDKSKLTRYMNQSANSGFVPAMAFLAYLHRGGHFGVVQNPAIALAWAEKGARAGDAESMVLAAELLREIRPTEKAAHDRLIAKAADLKHLRGMALHVLASIPSTSGEGSWPEAAARLRIAVDIAKKASERDDPLRPNVYSRAKSLFQIATLVEIIRTQKTLGSLFTEADSLDLFRKAAKGGYAPAAGLLRKRRSNP